MSGERGLTWEGPEAKARYLDAAAHLDARLPQVRAAVREACAAAVLDLRAPPAVVARALHRWVRDRIEYRRDHEGRGIEDLADSAVIIERGWDDCDGKARLFVAMCDAAGLAARILPVIEPGERFSHVQAEVNAPGHPRAGPGGWVLAELIIRGLELGERPREAPRDELGRRWLAGPNGRPLDSSGRR